MAAQFLTVLVVSISAQALGYHSSSGSGLRAASASAVLLALSQHDARALAHGHSHLHGEDLGHSHLHGEDLGHSHLHGHSHSHGQVEEQQSLLMPPAGSTPHEPQATGAQPHGHSHAHAHSHGHGHGHGHGHSHGGSHRVLEDHEKHVVSAMIVTTLSGLAAAFGGAIVLFAGTPSPSVLGHLLSFACGIMLYISYGDLLPHAQAHMATYSPDTGPGDDPDGFWGANVAMLLGMLFFAAVVWVVPEPQGHHHDKEGNGELHAIHEPSGDGSKRTALLKEAVPSGTKPDGDGLKKRKGRAAPETPASTESQGAAALPEKQQAAAAVGPTRAESARRDRLAMTGLVAALGISLHNLPEGLIVYNQSVTGLCANLPETSPGVHPSGVWGTILTALGVPGGSIGQCFTRGLAVTMAVALHNIPEGMAVASPLYASTGSRWTAFKWCLLSSLCEPLAALVFGAFFSSYLTPHLVATLNASVAGIMICLCLIELIPAACEHISPKAAVLSNVAGQAVMFFSLHAMRMAGLH